MKTVLNNFKWCVVAISMVWSSTTLFANSSIALKAEEIKEVSQNIAKNYFYISQKIQSSAAKKALKEGIKLVDTHIGELQTVIKPNDEKRIVEFMKFSIEEIKQVAYEAYSIENGGLLLDYSETLLEGADTLLSHNISKKDSMLNPTSTPSS
jgi:hypothetical protein